MAAQKGKGSAGGGGSGGKVGGSGVDAGVTGGKGAPDDNHSDISDEESQHCGSCKDQELMFQCSYGGCIKQSEVGQRSKVLAVWKTGDG